MSSISSTRFRVVANLSIASIWLCSPLLVGCTISTGNDSDGESGNGSSSQVSAAAGSNSQGSGGSNTDTGGTGGPTESTSSGANTSSSDVRGSEGDHDCTATEISSSESTGADEENSETAESGSEDGSGETQTSGSSEASDSADTNGTTSQDDGDDSGGQTTGESTDSEVGEETLTGSGEGDSTGDGTTDSGSDDSSDTSGGTEFCELDPLPDHAGSVIDFDEMPVTGEGDVPGSSSRWLYTSATTNADPAYYMTANDSSGWRQVASRRGGEVLDFFYRYENGYNTKHMGFTTYGYLDIADERSVFGSAMRFVTTGGKNDMTLPGANGLEVGSKEQYLEHLAEGRMPIEGGMEVGHPTIYWANTGNSRDVPFTAAKGANRLSIYMYLPPEVDNGVGGQGRPPSDTITVGPFNDVGGHWYHTAFIQGGGWVRFLVDGHPQHNNSFNSADDWPYPSNSVRDQGVAYFDTMYRYYITIHPYQGVAEPPYNWYFDEIEFLHDDEPQNNETINSPALAYYAEGDYFEISFNDKYVNNAHGRATYEVRYSFSEITNENWDSATPVHIRATERFGIEARTDGRFQKWWPHYRKVWASFDLASQADRDMLTPCRRIYFAVKDRSQIDGDSTMPITEDIGRWSPGGRDYANYPEKFDYEGDKQVLNLIKRIDYVIPQNP